MHATANTRDKIYGHSLYGQRVAVFTGLPSVTDLKGHEFVVWFWGPGVHLHAILQSNHQELYLLVAHYRKRIEEHMERFTPRMAGSLKFQVEILADSS